LEGLASGWQSSFEGSSKPGMAVEGISIDTKVVFFLLRVFHGVFLRVFPRVFEIPSEIPSNALAGYFIFCEGDFSHRGYN
jgi:hypothetical protein